MSEEQPTMRWNISFYNGKHSFVAAHGEALLDPAFGAGHLTKRIAGCREVLRGLPAEMIETVTAAAEQALRKTHRITDSGSPITGGLE
jgi:hypothetical protein